MMGREEKLARRFGMAGLVAKKVVNSLTGDTQKKAGKQAVKELTKGREAVTELLSGTRGNLADLFADAQESRRGGLEGALNVFQGSIPLQAQVAQGGNVAAQQALLAGLPQIQNAILGNQPIDMSGLQPTQLPFDLSFINQPLPQGPTIQRPVVEETATNTGLGGGGPRIGTEQR